jgi:hypothetical protein
VELLLSHITPIIMLDYSWIRAVLVRSESSIKVIPQGILMDFTDCFFSCGVISGPTSRINIVSVIAGTDPVSHVSRFIIIKINT